MSGPKVVRVVTREELVVRANDQIAAFESTVKKYEALAKGHDIDITQEIASHRRTAAELKSLVQSSQWQAIARQSSETARTVAHQHDTLLERIVAAASKDRTVRRRLKDAAKSISAELNALGIAKPAELDDIVKAVESATEDQLRAMDATLMAAIKLLVQKARPSNATNSELAERLSAGLEKGSYREWLAHNNLRKEDTKFERLDKLLAEMEVEGIRRTATIDSVIEQIQEATEERRDLLIDSLAIELSAYVKQQRQNLATRDELTTYAANLESETSPEARGLLLRIQATIAGDEVDDAATLSKEAHALLDRSRRQASTRRQRKALLVGLTALGYEIREGMATALVENGRLVVRKPAEIDYGVEIIGASGEGRMQVRMVSFDAPTNPTRDHDAEVIWCGEFSQLRKTLAEAGHILEIEKAFDPGAVPMKREALANLQKTDAEQDIRQQKSRTL